MEKPRNFESQKRDWQNFSGKGRGQQGGGGPQQHRDTHQHERFVPQINYSEESPNTGWLFYRDYYNPKYVKWSDSTKGNIDVRNVEKKNKRIFGQILTKHPIPQLSGGFQTLKLKTTYPGLLTGSGISHAFGNVDDEIKLGFAFDYTSGLPYLPGSSVKGAIRSAFKKLTSPKSEVDNADAVLIFKEWLGAKNDLVSSFEDIKNLETAIFNSDLNPYAREVFFDAFPIESQMHDGQFLASDFITPHRDGPFKDPVPIQFMKVLPEVVFEFRFRLYPTTVGEVAITVDDKLRLFKNILLTLGIGAKTNVGYGQFSENVSKDNSGGKEGLGQKKREPAFEERITDKHRVALAHNEHIADKNLHKALISNISETEIQFRVLDDCYLVKSKTAVEKKFEQDSEKRKAKNKPHEYHPLEIGDEVIIRINPTTEPGQISFTILPNWKI